MLVSDWLSLANVITAIVAILATSAVALFIARKQDLRRLTIVQDSPSVLFQSSQNDAASIEVLLNGTKQKQVNRQNITLKNSGTKALEGVSVTIQIPHDTDVQETDIFVPSVTKNFIGEYDRKIYDPKLQMNRFVIYTIEYLNPKEIFEVEILYSGEPALLDVDCRMKDVQVKHLRKPDAAGVEAFAIEILSAQSLGAIMAKSLGYALQRFR